MNLSFISISIIKHSLHILFFTFLFSCFACTGCDGQNTVLCSLGTAKYTIYVSGNSDKEQQAAKILQGYLKKISGASFTISTQESDSGNIMVLAKESARKLYPAIDFASLEEDGVLIKNDGKNLLISGDEAGGLRNAVYEFLEKFMGCRYYSPDAIYIPNKPTISIADNLNYKYVPSIKYRFTSSYEAFQGGFPEWHKLNNIAARGVAFPPPGWGLWIHSYFTLVPPGKYFKDHPEYYALRNGKRVATQLCLTNPDVVKIVRDTLAAIIRSHPQDKFFSVSQMDNNGYCQCDNCQRIANQEGSQSGPIIQFANQVAAGFPDKIISTLVYNYSRSAPKNIKPAPNVNVMFCATGVDRAVAFNDDKSPGSVFQDLQNWRAKTSNIFFWDYLVDFRHFFMPFPTYHLLQPNIQFLAENHIPYTILQGWNWRPVDMSELECYLTSQLLWNPDIDVNIAQKEFIDYYYGPAGNWIEAYVNNLVGFMKSHKIQLTNSDAPLDHVDDYLSPAQVKLYMQYFAKAEEAVKNSDSVYRNRVNKAEQSLRYTILEVNSKQDTDPKNTAYYLDVLDKFKAEADKEKADLVDEGRTKTADYYNDDKIYLKNRLVHNLAAGAFAQIISPKEYIPKQDLKILFDGILGNKVRDSKWVSFEKSYVEFVIDMGKPVPFDTIKMNFIHDPDFLTFLPDSITFSISNNSKDFTQIGQVKNTWTGLGVKGAIKTFQFVSPAPKNSRYIKIGIKMIDTSSYIIYNKQPVMLCDEVIVL